ncbi:MAG: hypothetical protein J6A75_04675 [Lachnospiraceae bacterium]|nr:hypothetical protein [Lachnospiraceae bacterium]
MSKNQIKFNGKIYLEAEDVAQTRILSTTSAVEAVFKNSKNPYISAMKVEADNDMEDFILRICICAEIEEICENDQNVEMLAPQLAELLTDLAQAHSYLEMEGRFSVECGELKEAYRIISEGGDDLCDFEPIE